VCDVFVLDEHATRDAGFTPLANPGMWMERVQEKK